MHVMSSVDLEVLDVALHGQDLALSYRGGSVWKQLQPLVPCRCASEGEEDAFELHKFAFRQPSQPFAYPLSPIK